MPKNTKGGNKAKKGANKRVDERKKLIEPTEGQYIALVINYLGRGACNLKYIGPLKDENGVSKGNQLINARGLACGKNRRYMKQIPRGSLVLVSSRDFQKGVVDILTMYDEDHINTLKKSRMIDNRILSEMRALDANKIKAPTKGDEETDDIEDGAVNFAYDEDEELPKDRKKRIVNQIDYSDLVLIPDDYTGEDWDAVDNQDDGDPDIDFI